MACLSYGTTATINTTSTKYVEGALHPAIPGGAAPRELAAATEHGVAPEALFDRLVHAVPPGSMGLMLQPYRSPGIRVPGRRRKAQ